MVFNLAAILSIFTLITLFHISRSPKFSSDWASTVLLVSCGVTILLILAPITGLSKDMIGSSFILLQGTILVGSIYKHMTFE